MRSAFRSSTRRLLDEDPPSAWRSPSLVLAGLILLTSGVGSLKAEEEGRVAFLHDIVIHPGDTAGDAVCILCSIQALGTIEGDAVVIGGMISVRGSIGGEAVAVGGGIHLETLARIKGEAVAIGGPVDREPGSVVGDEVTQMPYFHLPGQRRIYLRGTLSLIVFLLSITGIFCLVWRSSRLEIVAGVLRERPWSVFMAGLSFWVAVTIIYYLAVHAGPAAGLIQSLNSALIVVSLGLGYTGASLAVGRRLRPSWTPLRSLFLGASATTLWLLAPVLGFIAFCVLSVLGSGASLVSRFGTSRALQQERAPAAATSTDG